MYYGIMLGAIVSAFLNRKSLLILLIPLINIISLLYVSDIMQNRYFLVTFPILVAAVVPLLDIVMQKLKSINKMKEVLKKFESVPL